MRDLEKNACRIALVQAEPVLFNKQESLKKALVFIEEAAQSKAELIVFPELFIPGYPVGMNFGFSVGKRTEPGRKDWKRYYDASVVADGDEFTQLANAAKKYNVYISIGFSERDIVGGTLYNSNAIFEPDGTYKTHRKLKPTGSERTPWGPIGSLICWESYMPLARVALYQKGITIYISPNTNDNPEWQATIQHIAIEGKCYFINADMIITKGSYPKDLNAKTDIEALPDVVCRGGSCIIDPYGHYATEPVWDEETIIYAELDMNLPAACKMEHDAVGHYSRPDVLQLVVTDK